MTGFEAIVGSAAMIYVWRAVDGWVGKMTHHEPKRLNDEGESQPTRLFPAAPLTQAVDLPESIVSYCDGESEEFAVDDCYARARDKYTNVTKDWSVVLTSLQREDGVVK